MYIEVEKIRKSYGEGGALVHVLNGVSTQIEKGEICVILGPSGSGKSTFLNVIGGLETTDSGRIRIGGEEITGMKPEELSDYRRETLGFVFQFYNLIPDLTVRENIEVCRYLSAEPLESGYCWRFWVLWSTRTNFRLSSPVDSSRGAPLPGRWLRTRPFCSVTNPRERWIPEPQRRSLSSLRRSTADTGLPC